MLQGWVIGRHRKARGTGVGSIGVGSIGCVRGVGGQRLPCWSMVLVLRTQRPVSG